MSATLKLGELTEALRQCVRSTEEATEAFRSFGAVMWATLWNSPVLLRAWGGAWLPKKVRRVRGRRIKRLERGLK